MALINYNFTRLKCTDCGKLFELKPSQQLDEVLIKCECKKEAVKQKVEANKRTKKPKVEADAT